MNLKKLITISLTVLLAVFFNATSVTHAGSEDFRTKQNRTSEDSKGDDLDKFKTKYSTITTNILTDVETLESTLLALEKPEGLDCTISSDLSEFETFIIEKSSDMEATSTIDDALAIRDETVEYLTENSEVLDITYNAYLSCIYEDLMKDTKSYLNYIIELEDVDAETQTAITNASELVR